jgi:hypothetical protein
LEDASCAISVGEQPNILDLTFRTARCARVAGSAMSDENDLSSPIGTRDARVGGCVRGERGKVQADAAGPADGTPR